MRGKRRDIITLQKNIHEYIKRRDVYSSTLGFDSSLYLGMECKIEKYRKQLRRVSRRVSLIKWTEDKIYEFIGYKPSKIQNCGGNREKHISKNLLYKYCIENGVRGDEIATFCSLKDQDGPANARRRFTRSFKDNSYNKEMWHRFKLFIKDYEDETINT